jgi:lipopolysaccharide assembly outer membrane protein LptD (OstA)
MLFTLMAMAPSPTPAIMEIDTEFSHILAETIISNFTTGEWLSADQADRIAGDRGIFDASRFTPCKCDFLNGERPLWDIKASQSVRNEKTQTITHYNMRMSVLNVPGRLSAISCRILIGQCGDVRAF